MIACKRISLVAWTLLLLVPFSRKWTNHVNPFNWTGYVWSCLICVHGCAVNPFTTWYHILGLKSASVIQNQVSDSRRDEKYTGTEFEFITCHSKSMETETYFFCVIWALYIRLLPLQILPIPFLIWPDTSPRGRSMWTDSCTTDR